jgi:hypothetical protein
MNRRARDRARLHAWIVFFSHKRSTNSSSYMVMLSGSFPSCLNPCMTLTPFSKEVSSPVNETMMHSVVYHALRHSSCPASGSQVTIYAISPPSMERIQVGKLRGTSLSTGRIRDGRVLNFLPFLLHSHHAHCNHFQGVGTGNR